MISFNTYDEKSENELEVALLSNRWEFELSVGKYFHEYVNLNKKQVSELIVALVEIHKEMI